MAYNYENQKKYNNSCNVVRIKYSKTDMSDYNAMISYIESLGITTTAYIKQLIRKDLESKGLLDN